MRCFGLKNRFIFLLRQNYSSIDSNQLPRQQLKQLDFVDNLSIYWFEVCFIFIARSVFWCSHERKKDTELTRCCCQQSRFGQLLPDFIRSLMHGARVEEKKGIRNKQEQASKSKCWRHMRSEREQALKQLLRISILKSIRIYKEPLDAMIIRILHFSPKSFEIFSFIIQYLLLFLMSNPSKWISYSVALSHTQNDFFRCWNVYICFGF